MARRSRRTDLLRAAGRRFYRDGIAATGVDTLTAEAGTAKMTLYNAFGSKDALVVAYLEERDRRFFAQLDAEIATRSAPLDRALAVVDCYARYLDEAGFRGCAFVNAGAELPAGHPGRAVIAGHKARVLERWTELVAALGAPEPARTARTCDYLLEGAFTHAGVGLDGDGLALVRELIAERLTASRA